MLLLPCNAQLVGPYSSLSGLDCSAAARTLPWLPTSCMTQCQPWGVPIARTQTCAVCFVNHVLAWKQQLRAGLPLARVRFPVPPTT
jgi:hypothetical protein